MKDDGPAGCLAGLFVGCIMSWLITSAFWNAARIREAVRHGEAHYDSKTGELIWKDPEPPTAAPRQE